MKSALSTEKTESPTGEKYARLVEYCAARIAGGEWQGGEKLPTFVELQRVFGVTPGTVNRAMITLEQRGLVERRRGSGVYVTQRVRGVRTGIVGVAGYGFRFSGDSSYWETLMSGIREEAARAGMQLLLLDHESPLGWEKADGLLICDWSNYEALRYVPPSLPCVSVMVPAESMASVAADDYAGVHAATEHLLGLGHRRVAYLHNTNAVFMPRRIAGYSNALEAAGVQPDARWMRLLPKGSDYGEQFVHTGHGAMAQWLREDWTELGCTALLCQNDETAIGAMEALREAGLRVPEDVSVVGFDGLAIGSYFRPRLTTVEIPLRQIGVGAMELLFDLITRDKVSAEHRVLPAQLRVRESTGLARAAH